MLWLMAFKGEELEITLVIFFYCYDKSHLGKEGFTRVHSFRRYSPPWVGEAQQQEHEAVVT